jgi:tRNA(Ile)-lysidine synthase
VSGGPDSTALLALAVAAVEGSGRGVTAHHVDHGVRPAGDAESEAVSVLADGWGAGFVAHRVDVAPGGNLEERLRTARRAALPPGTLLGHTADDQAETVVQRILRGTGPAGLAAMSTGTHPMLGLRRAEAAALCHHLGVSPLRDPTNDDPRFTRNRVRAEVLPLLDDVAGRDVVPLLARLAALAADQADALAALTADVDPCDARALAGAEPALAREALRAWWRDESGHPPPDAAALDRMMAVASGAARSCDVTAGWRLVRSAGRLALRGPGGAGDHPPAGR